ncbi:DUF2817 domain-containing protein [Candidatus Saccharibacteria bacterium]|nr:MAG: DUF2817 domain-containing protein [Candidatus Saccharibacteria bacterium]
MLSEIKRLGFSIESHYSYLSTLGDKFRTTLLETIEYKDKGYPIYCIDFCPDATGQRLFILSGSHGNEEAGLIAVERFIEFLDTVGEETNVAIRIVTPHNPVGTAMFSRYNGQGYDMNRDFAKKEYN